MTAIRPQPLASFRPCSPLDGYYNDLTRFARANHTALSTATNPVTVAQIGLGAWQSTSEDPRFLDVVGAASRWLIAHMDGDGRLAYHFPMAHTYHLDPPWYSAMAQGETASFLVRAARSLGKEELRVAAGRAAACLVEREPGLVADTDEGPVLQEYPTDPPAHVLNGWIFALWGLYDVAWAGPQTAADGAMTAFEDGIAALSRRLPKYQLPGGWSRYDLREDGPINVASPFYHHLHTQQLMALDRLVDDRVFAATAAVWRRAWHHPTTVAGAIAGKVRFRRRHPRRGQA